MSHYKCVNEALKSKYNICGIIEDDIKLVDDFEIKIKNYFKNSVELMSKINNEPVIIFMTGLTTINPRKQYKFKNKENMFVNIGPQYGNCFYIINKKMAELIIKNFVPINLPFDDFIMSLKKRINFNNYYSAVPILCYDLSSDYYKKYWTKEDLFIKRKVFYRLSLIGDKNNNIEKKINLNITNNIFGVFLREMFKKIIIENKESTNILFSDYLVNSNKNTIICGSGINSSKTDNLNFREIYFVRGKLTSKFIDKYYCKSKIEGDPLILIKEFLNLEIKNNDTKFCFIVKEMPNLNLSNNSFRFINSENFNFNNINSIQTSEIIFTDSLLPLIISHSLYKKVYCINEILPIDIVDYYTSYNIPLNLIKSISLNELFINNIYQEKEHLEISSKIINEKKSNISELIYFVSLDNNFN